MTVRVLLAACGLLIVAACGSNNGNGDNSPTNGITSIPKASVVCTSAPSGQVCGPTPSPSASPSAG